MTPRPMNKNAKIRALREETEEYVKQRDEARAAAQQAFQRGAEAMRELLLEELLLHGPLVLDRGPLESLVRAVVRLPVPEDK